MWIKDDRRKKSGRKKINVTRSVWPCIGEQAGSILVYKVRSRSGRTGRRCTSDGMDNQRRDTVIEFRLADVFLILFILNMDRKPKVVEFFILGPLVARLALARVTRQRMVGSAITTTTPRSSNFSRKRRLVRQVRATRSQPLSYSHESSLHS